MKIEYKELGLKEFNLKDDRFNFNFQPNQESIRNSIESLGLIQPLLAYDRGEGKPLLLVDGWRRISVIQELKIEIIKSLIISDCEWNKVIDIYFAINSTNRQYNLIELNIMINKLEREFGLNKDIILSDYFKYVNLNRPEESFKLIKKLNNIVEPLKPIIIRNEINLRNAAAISSWSSTDQGAILPLLSTLRFNTNKLRIMLLYLEEITQRDGKTVAEVLEVSDIGSIMNNKDLTENEKITSILSTLESKRYPEYTKLNDKLGSLKKALNIPPGIKFETPEHFEGNKFKIAIDFGNKQELKEAIDKLSDMVKRNELDSIIDMY